jgi:hypothetical protein
MEAAFPWMQAATADTPRSGPWRPDGVSHLRAQICICGNFIPSIFEGKSQTQAAIRRLQLRRRLQVRYCRHASAPQLQDPFGRHASARRPAAAARIRAGVGAVKKSTQTKVYSERPQGKKGPVAVGLGRR